jgi:hypothetical protein
LKKRIGLFLWCLWLLPGCGYRFTARGAGLPEQVTHVCVPLFSNRTDEPVVETLFTQALREELLRAGRLGSRNCDAVIEGEIQTVTSAQTMTELASYRLSASVRLRLRKGDRLLSETLVQGGEEFLRGADILLTDSQRQAAFYRLAPRLMSDGYRQMANVW